MQGVRALGRQEGGFTVHGLAPHARAAHPPPPNLTKNAPVWGVLARVALAWTSTRPCWAWAGGQARATKCGHGLGAGAGRGAQQQQDVGLGRVWQARDGVHWCKAQARGAEVCGLAGAEHCSLAPPHRPTPHRRLPTSSWALTQTRVPGRTRDEGGVSTAHSRHAAQATAPRPPTASRPAGREILAPHVRPPQDGLLHHALEPPRVARLHLGRLLVQRVLWVGVQEQELEPVQHTVDG